MTTKAELEAVLSSLPLFKGVRPGVVRTLAAKMKAQTHQAGEILPPQEGVGDWCWLVLGGLIERRVIASGGRIVAIDISGPGDAFGSLMDCCELAPEVETVALALTRTARLEFRAMKAIVSEEPDLIRNLIDSLKRRLAEAQALRAITAEPASRRMIWTVVWLYSKLGRRLPLTRARLAEVGGVTRETAIRELAPLEKKGYLRTTRGMIEVRDPKALAELMRS